MRRKLTKITGILCIIFGVGMLIYLGVDRYFVEKSLTLSRTQVQTIAQDQAQTGQAQLALPTHVSIDGYVNIDVEPLALLNKKWVVSDTEATYLQESARPGEKGNIIIYGHNKRAILGNMRYVKGNEIIHLTTADGKDHQYKILLRTVVSPNDITYLLPTRNETLTMYTCTGFWDSKRFILRAEAI